MLRQPDEQADFAFLDEPPPAAAGGRRARWRAEMLLGLLLLLTVAGWSLADWHRQEQRAAYNDGRRYATGRDWDNALAAFRVAGDYADAAGLAQQAAVHIVDRGRLYGAASAAAGQEDWLTALQDLRQLDTVQPNYRDSRALRLAAEAHTYRAALAGVVARRTQASPAGLYLRSDQGWVWLSGSDPASSVHGFGPGGCVLYDAPTGRASLDGTAANPNLFATSVLSLDLAPEARGLRSVQIAEELLSADERAGRPPWAVAGARADQPGALHCAADFAPPAIPAHSWHRSGRFLAYIADGDLRVRTADDTVDLLLEQGVQGLYEPTP